MGRKRGAEEALSQNKIALYMRLSDAEGYRGRLGEEGGDRERKREEKKGGGRGMQKRHPQQLPALPHDIVILCDRGRRR